LLYAFGVHGAVDPHDMVALTLSERQRQTKAAAIELHTTQMQLSRRRFVGYAGPREPFRQVPLVELAYAEHAVQAVVRSGELRVTVDLASLREPLRGRALFVVLDRTGDTPCRRIVWLTGTRCGTAVDPSTGKIVGGTQVLAHAAQTRVTIAGADGCAGGWIKLGRSSPGLFVFDKTGWQVVSTETERGPGFC